MYDETSKYPTEMWSGSPGSFCRFAYCFIWVLPQTVFHAKITSGNKKGLNVVSLVLTRTLIISDLCLPKPSRTRLSDWCGPIQSAMTKQTRIIFSFGSLYSLITKDVFSSNFLSDSSEWWSKLDRHNLTTGSKPTVFQSLWKTLSSENMHPLWTITISKQLQNMSQEREGEWETRMEKNEPPISQTFG